MKKIIITILVISALFLTGCGSESENKERDEQPMNQEQREERNPEDKKDRDPNQKKKTDDGLDTIENMISL